MSINQEEVMLRPEQLVALENMRNYGVPDEIIEKTRQDFENANYEMLGSRKRGGTTVTKKIDAADYVRATLPAIGDRQDLAKSLELITAFSLVIDAEVVDKAKELIKLDELNTYDVIDCVRAIYAVVDGKRGWGDRDTKGRLSTFIDTLKPEEPIEFETEDEKKEDGAVFPKPETETTEDTTTVTTTTGGRKKQEPTDKAA